MAPFILVILVLSSLVEMQDALTPTEESRVFRGFGRAPEERVVGKPKLYISGHYRRKEHPRPRITHEIEGYAPEMDRMKREAVEPPYRNSPIEKNGSPLHIILESSGDSFNPTDEPPMPVNPSSPPENLFPISSASAGRNYGTSSLYTNAIAGQNMQIIPQNVVVPGMYTTASAGHVLSPFLYFQLPIASFFSSVSAGPNPFPTPQVIVNGGNTASDRIYKGAGQDSVALFASANAGSRPIDSGDYGDPVQNNAGRRPIDSGVPVQNNAGSRTIYSGVPTQNNAGSRTIYSGVPIQNNAGSRPIDSGVPIQNNAGSRPIDSRVPVQNNAGSRPIDSGVPVQNNAGSRPIASGVPVQNNAGSSPIDSGVPVQNNAGSRTFDSGVPVQNNAGSRPIDSGVPVQNNAGSRPIDSRVPVQNNAGSRPIDSEVSVQNNAGSRPIDSRVPVQNNAGSRPVASGVPAQNSNIPERNIVKIPNESTNSNEKTYVEKPSDTDIYATDTKKSDQRNADFEDPIAKRNQNSSLSDTVSTENGETNIPPRTQTSEDHGDEGMSMNRKSNASQSETGSKKKDDAFITSPPPITEERLSKRNINSTVPEMSIKKKDNTNLRSPTMAIEDEIMELQRKIEEFISYLASMKNDSEIAVSISSDDTTEVYYIDDFETITETTLF